MAYVYACEFPPHLWYHVERDVWIEKIDKRLVRLGMTDPAQTRAGKLLHVNVRSHRLVQAGKTIATIESGKWLGPFPAPVPGVVVAENTLVQQDPNVINRDPYGQGWIVVFEAAVGEEVWSQYDIAMGISAVDAYRQKLKRDGLTCLRCAPWAPADNPGQEMT